MRDEMMKEWMKAWKDLDQSLAHAWNFLHVLFGKFHADSSGYGVLYKNSTSSTSSLLSFFSFSSLFSFTLLYNKAINEHYHIYPLTVRMFSHVFLICWGALV